MIHIALRLCDAFVIASASAFAAADAGEDARGPRARACSRALRFTMAIISPAA